MDTQDSNTRRSRGIPGGLLIAKFLGTIGRIGFGGSDSKLQPGITIEIVSDFGRKFSLRKILLVGSNPSSKSPDCSAFHFKTKSRQFVDKWFENDFWYVRYDNLVDFKTEKNKQLSTAQIRENLDWIIENMNEWTKLGYKVVACGKIAAKGLTIAGIDHFEMPHPSGLCRFWNDKEAGEAKVKEMKKWALNTYSPKTN